MDETLQKLKVQLDLQDWPNVYYFKFIVPIHKREELISLFPDHEKSRSVSLKIYFFMLISY